VKNNGDYDMPLQKQNKPKQRQMKTCMASKYLTFIENRLFSVIRAFRDVENFLDRTLLVLNLDKNGLDEILEVMFEKIKDDKTGEDKFSTAESMSAVFSHQSGKECFLLNISMYQKYWFLICSIVSICSF
jgi:hypothetical protein